MIVGQLNPMMYMVAVVRFNFSASRSEIARGNTLRLAAGLLPLDDAKELRRMFQVHQFKRWLTFNLSYANELNANIWDGKNDYGRTRTGGQPSCLAAAS